jgi:ornithine lipid ester-linked acyl 2-hydroxylase
MDSPRDRKTAREYAYDAAMMVLRPAADLIARTSLVPTTPFLDAGLFPWIANLEAHWRDIRDELERVLVFHDHLPAFHEINGDATDIRSELWKSFFFYGFNLRSNASCERCPKTAALIEEVPGVTTALFSILAPGARLPPHRGPWNGVLRYHLGLKVPKQADRCRIEVNGEKAYWQEGKSLVFDDTYEHAVWNDTTETRVVLFLDVVRPCRAPGSWVNWAVLHAAALTPFVRSSMRRQRKWEEEFAAKAAPLQG